MTSNIEHKTYNLKQNKGIAPVVIAIIVAILLSAGAGVTYQITKDKNKNKNNNPPVVGGDKDAHGCIGSAGESWCELKQKCLRRWEEKCENALVVPANWKTYTNVNYGPFSLKYPTEWGYQDFSFNIEGTAFCPPTMKKASGCGMTSDANSTAPIILYPLSLGAATGGNASTSHVWTLGSNQIQLLLGDPKYKDIFDLMVSSYSTNTTVDTTGWKTYTNTKYGFEVKYPKNWTDISNKIITKNILAQFALDPAGADGGYLNVVSINVRPDLLNRYKSLASLKKAFEKGEIKMKNINLPPSAKAEMIGNSLKISLCEEICEIYYYYIDENNIFEITIESSSGNAYNDVLAGIASTFKFTSVQAGSLKVLSPNGGESWVIGSKHNITWSGDVARKYDLRLVSAQASCQPRSGSPCVGQTYSIAWDVSGGTYQWIAGRYFVDGIDYLEGQSNPQVVGAGQYLLQVCKSGSNECDLSDLEFTLR